MVFLPALEPSDDVLCARQVLPLDKGVVVGQGDSDIKGVVWLRAGPAQPGTALRDICDLDVLGLCCRAESEGAVNEEGKVSRKKVPQCCRIFFPCASQVGTWLSQMTLQGRLCFPQLR